MERAERTRRSVGREGPLPMFLLWGTVQEETGLGAESVNLGQIPAPLRGVYLVCEMGTCTMVCVQVREQLSRVGSLPSITWGLSQVVGAFTP